MKKSKKIVFIIIIIFMIVMMFDKVVYGISVSDFSGSDFNNNDAKNFANTLITALSVLGSVISVVVLIALGIKYMTGSVDEKATYKKTLVPYIIGCVLVFAASSIAGIIYAVVS